MSQTTIEIASPKTASTINFIYVFIAFLVFFEFTVYMANDLIMPGMVNLVHEFQAHESLIPLSLSIYILGGMTLQWIVGPVSDRIGRRSTMIFGAFFFSLFTFLITLSFSMSSFLTLRFFQGMGISFISVCGYATVQELFEEKQAVRTIAWMSTVAVMAPILGPIIGGFLIEVVTWRWIFFLLLICSLISAAGLWKFMPETVQRKAKTAEKPKLLSILKIEAPKVLHTYSKIIKNKNVMMGAVASGLMTAPVICWISVSPIVLFDRAHISPSLYGVVQIPIFGCYILGNEVLRRLTHKLNLNQILKVGVPICLASIALFMFLMVLNPSSYWSIIIPLSIYCFGNGIISAPLTRKTLYASEEGKGSVSAVFQLVCNIVLVGSISLMPFFFPD